MIFFNDGPTWLILLLILESALALSYNQPKFCPNASWNPDATTFADNNTVGIQPYAIFVNTNNTVFVARHDNGQLLVWRNGSVNPTTTILANLSSPLSLFVSSNDELFVDNGYIVNRVDRWALNGTTMLSPIPGCSQCYGLFVDNNNDLYCSQHNSHQVVKVSMDDPDKTPKIVAGTGCWGSTSTTLTNPWGIFVTGNWDLYVADNWNNRIQFFRQGARNATTMVGSGSNVTITLNMPTGVVLDGDGYLFIVDSGNHRIVGSGPYGVRCVVGCSGSGGSGANQLNNPQTLSFDTDGNMLVADRSNNRIQKFLLCNDTYGE